MGWGVGAGGGVEGGGAEVDETIDRMRRLQRSQA